VHVDETCHFVATAATLMRCAVLLIPPEGTAYCLFVCLFVRLCSFVFFFLSNIMFEPNISKTARDRDVVPIEHL